ncbi:hypothetical protein J4E86_006815 [Alternaria arbusti]|uniref:uncharacterized protein n=1 Tax=Alternaria arbusti TaxID=232088 RepID=UPI00221F2B61|nr:uncharacterized protein J4E86_006815 [Alternaria arbusti]KAI4953274.1 hypothetical protein J4E86_006815 [Alternaria arbusti]
MTDLCGLPDELLLAVAKCLRDDTKNGYSDLNHLALNCRKLRPIAQEVFHTDISITPTLKRGLARLARTLLQRPDLARRVLKLNIELSGMPLTHHRNCVSEGHYFEDSEVECTCGIPYLGTHFMGFLIGVKSKDGVPLRNKGWEDMLMRGEDTALVGLILCVTPALSDLTLMIWDSPRCNDFDNNNVAWAEFEKVFENITRQKDLADCFQGLSSLKRLVTDGYPPCSWLSLPRLEAARINLFEDPSYNTMISQITPGATVSTTLTRLVIQPEFEALYSYDAIYMDGFYGHVRSVIRGLTNLTHLFILYRAIVDPYGRFDPLNTPRGSFAHIVSHLESRSLTNLTLDVEPALKDLVRYMIMLEYTRGVSPMTWLAGLPKLRNLNAPQEAFFSANEEFRTCHLPTTIESISIMDATYETKRYLKHLLDLQTEWPNLKTIKIGESPCNDQSVYPADSDDDASDAGERRKVSELDDSIYEQARSRGLRVEKVQDRTAWKKGWEGLGL